MTVELIVIETGHPPARREDIVCIPSLPGPGRRGCKSSESIRVRPLTFGRSEVVVGGQEGTGESKYKA